MLQDLCVWQLYIEGPGLQRRRQRAAGEWPHCQRSRSGQQPEWVTCLSVEDSYAVLAFEACEPLIKVTLV